MKFRKKQFGGTVPICTGSPSWGVVGGFNLDNTKTNIPAGVSVPGGSLAEYDEDNRTVIVLKSGRVETISADDAKVIMLESRIYEPIFAVGDHILKTVSGDFKDAPQITKITNDESGYVIRVSAEITGLSVGDALFQVVEGSGGIAALAVTAPQGLVISETISGTPVRLDETGIDVTTDTKGEYFYLRRIPPVPAKFISGICLSTNPNVQFTNSK